MGWVLRYVIVVVLVFGLGPLLGMLMESIGCGGGGVILCYMGGGVEWG